MNDQLTREERAAMIAGGRSRTLDSDEVADLGLLTDLLAHPSTWAETSAGLEDAVLQTILDAPPPHRFARRARRVASVGAAAVAIVAIAISLTVTHHAGPQSFDAEMRSPALTHGVAGSVAISENRAGYRVMLHAKGLPTLTAPRYYQAWLKDGTGTRVPIGTFSSCDGPITLWSGVPPETFSTITVTRESTETEPDATSEVVLVGAIRSA